MWNLKHKTKGQTQQEQTHGHREQTSGLQARQGLWAGAGWGDWVEQMKGIKRYTLSVITKMYLLLFSRSVVSNSLWPQALQHTRLPCPSPSPRASSNSCSLSLWCHPTILSSIVPFSSCPQFSPASGSFPVSRLFASGGQNIGASASASVLLMNIQDWSPLGWTGWISLQSKGLSRVFSNTIVQKHQFFSPQPSLWSNSHIHTWLLEKP